MNIYTQDIKKALNCTIETALQVQNKIDYLNLLDWSECTHAEIKEAARYALLYVQGLPSNGQAEGLTRDELIEILEVADPNGDYSDELMKASNLLPFDKETLLTIIYDMNHDNEIMDDRLPE